MEPSQMRKNHCRGGASSTGMYPWGSSYPLLPFLMKEFSKRGKNSSKRFFGQHLSTARMVIEWVFG